MPWALAHDSISAFYSHSAALSFCIPSLDATLGITDVLSGSHVVSAYLHFEPELFVQLKCVSTIFTQTAACSIWADCGSQWPQPRLLAFSECPAHLWSLSGRSWQMLHCGSMGTAFCSYAIKLVPEYDCGNFWDTSGKKWQMDDTSIVLC